MGEGCLPLELRRDAMERFQLLFSRARCRLLFKKLLDNLLLGCFGSIDKSLGAVYYVLDATFEGLEASKFKNTILPHNLDLSPSSNGSSSSSTPRSSNEFGAEDTILLSDGNTSVDREIQTIDSNGCNFRPRRSGIIAEKLNVKNLAGDCSEGARCTCWGWEVEEECQDEQTLKHKSQHKILDDDCGINSRENDDSNASDAITVRWSECQCPDCRKLWMPMSEARSRLHVQTWKKGHKSDLDLSQNVPEPCSKVSGYLTDRTASNTARCKQAEPIFVDRRQLSIPRSVFRANLNWSLKSTKSCQGLVSCRSNSIEVTKKTGVIFLHGLFSSSDFWFDSNVVPILSRSIKSKHLILAPDLLGCGRSPRPHDSVYTLSDQIDALENSLLKKHGLESFHVVGHSMGTIPAVGLAARYPNRIRSLTLIAPVYTGYTDPKAGGEEILTDCNQILSFEDPWSMRALRSLTASQYYYINRLFGHVVFTRHKLLVPIFQRLLEKSWPKSFVRDYLAVTHDAAWHIVHNTMIAGSHALVPALTKLRDRGKRVFVIHGTADTSCPFSQSEMMTKHFQNVVLAPIPGKGHVDVVLGAANELRRLLEKEIRLGDWNFENPPANCQIKHVSLDKSRANNSCQPQIVK